ncbi:MAG TPA: phosphatase PAP2 family protein [Ktedonobacteraceae bacterium]|nr:phosphatase PAP2 family protein [Ktedonobacteraceae bacterium]
MNAILQWNYALFQAINAHAGVYPWLDAVMIFCANTLIFFWPLLLLCVWGVPLRWRKAATSPAKAQQLEIRRAAVLWTALACVLAYGLNLLIEQVIFEPRPFVNHPVHLLLTHPADGSFPSDHAAWSFAVVGMIFFALITMSRSAMLPGKAATASMRRATLLFLLIALVIACLIGFARIFVGLHYPGDILGGAIDGLVGASIATALCRLLNRLTLAILRLASFLRLA